MIGLQTAVNFANEEATAEDESADEDQGGAGEGEGENARKKRGWSGGSNGGRGRDGGRSGPLHDLDVLEVSALDEVVFTYIHV